MNTETSQSAKQNSGAGSADVAAELKDYYIEKDGNGGEYQVMNLDHPKWTNNKFEGIVEIVPLKIPRGVTNPNTGIAPERHKSDISLPNFLDKKTKYWVGVPTGRAKDGSITWRSTLFKGVEFLDLADRDQRRKYVIFLHSPFYKKSPNFLLSSKTVYDIVDREAQNEQFFSDRNKRLKAGAIADALRGEELIDTALAMGFDPNLMTKGELQRRLVEFAESDDRDRSTGKTGSEVFLEYYTSDSRVEFTTFKRALSTAVITYDAANMTYNYNGLPIGRSEEEVVAYLKRNPVQFTSIDIQSKRIDSGSTKLESSSPVIKDEKDAENARLKERLAKMEEQMLEMSQRVVKQETKEKLKDVDEEYTNLLEEAKALKIKVPHLIGRGNPLEVRKQLLRDKVELAKSSKNN